MSYEKPLTVVEEAIFKRIFRKTGLFVRKWGDSTSSDWID